MCTHIRIIFSDVKCVHYVENFLLQWKEGDRNRYGFIHTESIMFLNPNQLKLYLIMHLIFLQITINLCYYNLFHCFILHCKFLVSFHNISANHYGANWIINCISDPTWHSWCCWHLSPQSLQSQQQKYPLVYHNQQHPQGYLQGRMNLCKQWKQTILL